MTIEQRISILEKKLKITEKNALQSYISKHPEKIKEFGLGDYYSWKEIAQKVIRDNPIEEKWYEILKKFEAKYPYCFKDIYINSSYTLDKLLSEKEPFEWFKNNEKHSYEKYKLDFDKYFDDFIREKDLKKLKILNVEKNNYAETKFKQLANTYGINVKDLAEGFREIYRMQSSSYQKLKPETYNLLKAITVVPSELPKVLYRGFFMDGAKIKNREKFLKQWEVGNTPKVKLGKPTSWSTSKAVATRFMVDQDRVKNKEEGYHILLKVTNPKFDEVIADFRNFDFSGYWNQQEVLLSPEITRYTVEEILPYQEYNDPNNAYKEFGNKNAKPGAGSFGMTKNEVLLDIFNLSKYDISLDTKIEYKEIKDLTIGELVKRGLLRTTFFTEDYKQTVYKILLPIYQFYKNVDWVNIVSKVISPSKVIMTSDIEFSNLSWRLSRSELKELEEMGFYDTSSYKMNDAVFSLETKIELVQNSINRFVFNVKFGDFKFVSSNLQDGEKIEKYMNQEDSIFKFKLYSSIDALEKRFPTVRVNIK